MNSCSRPSFSPSVRPSVCMSAWRLAQTPGPLARPPDSIYLVNISNPTADGTRARRAATGVESWRMSFLFHSVLKVSRLSAPTPFIRRQNASSSERLNGSSSVARRPLIIKNATSFLARARTLPAGRQPKASRDLYTCRPPPDCSSPTKFAANLPQHTYGLSEPPGST